MPTLSHHICKQIGSASALGDMRVRSKVRGTCCGRPFHDHPPPLLPADVAVALNARDRDLRKAAVKLGHTHVIARTPAKQASCKATKGIPSHLLPHISPNGVRRRLTSKTSSVVANLRFFQRNVVIRTETSANRRLSKKSTVIGVFGSEDTAVAFPVSRRVKARTDMPHN